jgi:branched-chain amino acid transport system permease protein
LTLSGGTLLRSGAVALWAALLFLPFRGLRAAAVLFGVLVFAIPVFTVMTAFLSPVLKKAGGAREHIVSLLPKNPAYLFLLVLPVLAVPLVAQNYIIDVAVLAGIYIILALGLNVVVGYTGLLNLGFVAYYAIGAYSFALLNTKLGMQFWIAMPVSVIITTAAGFLFAVPALRLRGDYLALVTLGFGEIVRITLNNWDSFTNGPNGIGGISAPSIFGASLDTLASYYYLVLFFVIITIVVMMRVQKSKVGRAWIAIREDEIAASAMGIRTLRYKLYSVSFGAFWAGLAGCLFASKMLFISPESFSFMESVLILSMVILGGLGSIGGVIVGAVILVILPEVLREVQMYRMLALGAGIVMLMIFRPQGLFGGKNASSRS